MIEVKDLSKYYNNFLALDKISFQVSNGEIVGLLGPNGAGKTTTLRLLTGYLEPSSGSIKVKATKCQMIMWRLNQLWVIYLNLCQFTKI